MTRTTAPTNYQRCLAENARLVAENAMLRKALQDIEMESRPGGQWTVAEMGEVARAALAPQ